MKKIMSCLIALSMVLSLAVSSYAAAENAETENTAAEKFANGIGLIDDETYEKDKVITRAEFAGILAELLQLNDKNAASNEWKDNNLGTNPDTTVSIDLSSRRFSDVDVSHPYYSQITAVCQRGYMNGVSENLFAPEYNLVMKDAVSVFINMLGYAEMAKLNSGISGTIGLTDGISIAMDKPATYGEIIKLIYNALNIEVLEIKFSGTDVSYETSEETFMTAVLGMDKVKAVMTDNGCTAFAGESRLNENQVQVGNIIANISENTEYVRDFIGHKVEMYYYTTEDEYEVAYAAISKDDDSITFDIADFESYDRNQITYFNGNRNIKKSLADNVYMIYNGEAKTVFDESVFDFESGKVTIIQTSGAGYDLIVVTCYEFAVVNSVSASSEIIYNKLKDQSKPELNEIDCSQDGEYEKVTIKDTAGNILSLADISKDNVLNILRNSKDITIIVSKTNVSGFIVKSCTTDENDKPVISNGEAQYKISDAYNNYSQRVQFNAGGTYAIYLNMFDNVVWAEKFAGGDNIGILTRARYSDEDVEPYREIRVFTSGGKLEKIQPAEKIKFNNESKKFEYLVTELEKHYGEAVMYTLDSNGILTGIITPEGFGTFGDRGWYEIAPQGDYTYHQNDNDLSQMMFRVSGTTTLFTTPLSTANFDDEKAFSANTYSFSDGGKVTAVGYAKDKYSVIADVIVVKSDSTSAGAVSALSDIMIIDKISQGLNDEDEVIDIIEGWIMDISAQNVAYGSVAVSDEVQIVDQQGNDLKEGEVKITGPKKFSELKQGDAIRYDLNSSKEIYKIRMAYDASTGSYFNTGAGGWGSDLSLYPGQVAASTAGSTWAGYALTKSGTGIRVTRGIDKLPSAINLSDIDTVKNSLWVFKVNRPNAILVVERENNGKISMRKGSVDDLITYQDSQKDASTDVLVMFTEWSSATRGTVIYKNFSFND